MKKKLRSRCGEMLVESIVAVLIISLASVVLASMITSASRLNKTAKEKDTELYAAITAAETHSGSGISGTVSVSVDGETVNKAVTFYCNDSNDPIYSYHVK